MGQKDQLFDGWSVWGGYLALFKPMDLLYPRGYGLFGVFKVEGGVPFSTRADLNSSVFPVFLLKFQDQVHRVALHLAFGEYYLRNFFYFLIGVALGRRGQLIILFNFLRGRPCSLGLISLRINYDHMLFLVGIEKGFLSVSAHPSVFIYYMSRNIMPACIILTAGSLKTLQHPC
jgi:hypothetical protein